jgi:predicted nucleic acid-binding protein
VREYLEGSFVLPWLGLSVEAMAALVGELATGGITGGAAYDALIAATAREAGATLITGDRRAEATYRRLGVRVEFLS